MSNILLIEPNYKNKYPPIGLMKIAYFHKYILHDYVRFTKGRLPEALSNTKWDRVYVTSLFTFEWSATIEAIKYARTLVESPESVLVGGIAATLMPKLIYEETGIYPVCGLLNKKEKIGLLGEECIDQLIPDYSVLDDIKDIYIYPFHDAYFLSATKGCGMRCGFCAVQTLEPTYVPYTNINTKITDINDIFGAKRDLLLMDNNVLRSNQFNRIIDDILEAGFEKGAKYINPKTGKSVKRYVDFNQGLDANLITSEKARRLGEIALRPARIAFDHIEDKEVYERAIRVCVDNGITDLSNYILYNSEDFTGKGRSYRADTPDDFYNRLRITLDLKEEINIKLSENNKVSIFSFPMRYIPLSARARGYVGSKWNPKFLRAVQCMLIPTQGKGVGSRSFFEADFGNSSASFIRNLCMPEKLIAARGNFTEGGRGRKNETEVQAKERKQKWQNNQQRLEEWNRLFDMLNVEKEEFIERISDNKFLPEKLLSLKSNLQKKLYLHYLTEPRILNLLGRIKKGSPTRDILYDYIRNEFSVIYEGLVSRIAFAETQQRFMFKNFIEFFGREGMMSILDALESIDYNADKQMALWTQTTKESGIGYIDFELIRLYRRFIVLNVLPYDEHNSAKHAIKHFDMTTLGTILYRNLNEFKEKLIIGIKEQQGEQIIMHATKLIISNIQTKLFDIIEENI